MLSFWLYRVHNHQNHVQEDEEMEEEDVEVDQENTETNSASGNVHIQICFLLQSVLDFIHVFNVYSRILILWKDLILCF